MTPPAFIISLFQPRTLVEVFQVRSHQPFRTPVACRENGNSPPSSPKAIRVRDVNFTWPNGRSGLTNICIDVLPGQISMIVGRNGCGKSTLLKVLRNAIYPDSGSVQTGSPIAYIMQDANSQILFPTIGTDIAMSVLDKDKKTKDQVREEIYESLRYVGLVPAEEFATRRRLDLSGGQKQRAVLAAALVRKPHTILFDEVTASLDPVSRADLLERVRKLVTERNIAAIWVTHVFDELDVADSIIIMEGGRIVRQGPKALMMPAVYDLEDKE